MYGYGGSDTKNWKNSNAYKYDSARRTYFDDLAADASKKGPRAYTKGTAPNMALVDPKGKEISTDSENPIIIGVDVTGSMAEWPAEFFDRAPLLYQTLSQYRPDMEICFSAIGDVHSDQFPLQVNSFGKGVALDDHIKALYPEGNGGGQVSESYETFGYFMKEHCKTPKALSPFLFMFGDENFYPTVNLDAVKHYIGDKLKDPVNSADVWGTLLQRFNVYLLRKPYQSFGSATDNDITAKWAAAIGKQRIIEVPSKERAVDTLMGIVAKHWGQFGDFDKNISARHDASTKASVYASIRHIPDSKATASVISRATLSKRTKPLA
jgi:hypothetical protein